MKRHFVRLTLLLSVSGFAQTPSGVVYPVATCVGGSCPGTATIPSHITATYFDTINEVVYLGGRFNDMGGNSRPGLAALNAVNGTLLSWSPVVSNGYVFSIAKSGDTVLVGGTFTQINGTTRNRIAAISASTGSLLSTFATGTSASSDTVMSLMVLGGKVYAGGRFTNIASTVRTNLARFTLSTGTLEGWISSPAVNGPVKKLLWFGTSIVTLTDNPAGPHSEISTLTNITGARTLRAQTEPAEKINDLALRGAVAFMIGTFSQINSISRFYTAACDLTNGTVAAWNPAPAIYNYDTRCRYNIEYYRDSLYIGTFDAGSNNPAYHKMYVSHYVSANLRVLKTYQSNLTGLNGYYNDAIIIGNARMLEIQRFAQHTAFPSGSISCSFYSYCLKPPTLPGIWSSATAQVCPGDTNIIYSLLHNGYFSAYTWQSLSTNLILTSNLNTALADFDANFSGTATIRVWGITSCGLSTNFFRAVNIAPLPLPDADAGSDDTLNCIISQLTLHGSSATTGAMFVWNWSTGVANADSIQVNSPDNYVLTVHGPNGCWKRDTALVVIDTVRPVLQPFPPPDSLTCADSVIVLDAAVLYPNDSLFWTGPGLVTPENPAAVMVTGNYLLTVTSRRNGCSNSDTVFIAQDYTPPPATIIAPDTVLTCAVTAVLLDASSTSATTSFQWSDTSGTIFTNPHNAAATGFYQLIATDSSNGCVNNANLILITSWLATPGINPLTDSVFLNCSYDSLHVQPASLTNGTTWQWSGPASSGNNDSVQVTQTGLYRITATHPQTGCVSRDSVYCNFLPVLNMYPQNDTTICFGSGAVLRVFPVGGTLPYSVLWNTGDNTTPLTVYPPDTLAYTVQLTDAAGCTGTDSIVVNMPDQLSDSVLTFQPCDPLQPTGQVQVYAYGGVPPYQYSMDNGISWNMTGVFPNLPYGIYPVVFRDTLGCIQTTLASIDTNSLSPKPDFLVSTSAELGDTLVIVDISNPRPDSVWWDFPSGFIVTDSSVLAPAVIAADTGNFMVIMHAYYGTCEVIYSRNIQFNPFDDQSANAWNSNAIDSLAIYPNPNNGNFTFHVGLQGKQSFVILVLDAFGNEHARVQVYESDSWTGVIEVANPVPGNYFIRVIAEYDSAQLPFVITQ